MDIAELINPVAIAGERLPLMISTENPERFLSWRNSNVFNSFAPYADRRT